MNRALIVLCMLLLVASAFAAEKVPLEQLSTDELVAETQFEALEKIENGINICWWFPYEFWKAIMINDKQMTQAQKDSMLAIVEDVAFLAVVQVDVFPTGYFDYYPKETIKKGMTVQFVDPDGSVYALSIQKDMNPELQSMMDMIAMILTNAMGNLGSNMHFFLIENEYDGKRIVDCYEEGEIRVRLTNSDGDRITTRLELPLDCLYVPRKCPNGKDAHVSWKFCPWTGEKLPD